VLGASVSPALQLRGCVVLLARPELRSLAFWGTLAANPTVASGGGGGGGVQGVRGSGDASFALADVLGWRGFLYQVRVRAVRAVTRVPAPRLADPQRVSLH
jgi:hypothetical protein